MRALAAYIKRIISGAGSLALGMSVTFSYLFKPPATVRYPRFRLQIPEAFRGHIELNVDPATGNHSCIACGICANTCPSGVITVRGSKKKGEGKEKGQASPDLFIIDYSRCSFCGLCVESCPRKALRYSKAYEQAGFTPKVAVVDLLAWHQVQAAASAPRQAA